MSTTNIFTLKRETIGKHYSKQPPYIDMYINVLDTIRSLSSCCLRNV